MGHLAYRRTTELKARGTASIFKVRAVANVALDDAKQIEDAAR